jgi:RNA polymerase sigma-70 factor (ECF subfamily)
MRTTSETTATHQHDTTSLYRAYARKVARWATRLTRSASDADDLVQEVFMVVHRRLPEVKHLENPAGWLLQMTRNLARHLWRSRGRLARRARSWKAECLPEVPRSPLEELEIRRAAEQMEAAVASLDDRYRQVYLLCEVEHLPSAHVAALTGLNPDTLRVRRFRARQQVSKRLETLVETAARAA